MAASKREAVIEAALLIAVVATVYPLWSVARLPLQDLPQHLAAIRVLHSYDDPSFGFSRFFELHPFRTQYLAYYFVADLLCHLVDVRVANLLLLSASVVATPYAIRSLSRALGGDGLGAWLCLPLTYNAHLILGFFNFVAAVPLALYGLSLAVRLRRNPRRGYAVGLALLAVVCFFTHVVPFALLALGMALVSLGGRAGLVAARLVPLLPAVLVAGVWLVGSPAGQATAAAAGATRDAQARPDFRPADVALHEVPQWMTAMFAPERDTRLLWAWAVLSMLLLTVSLVPWARVSAPDRLAAGLGARLWSLPLLSLVAYFVAPSGYAWIWPIAPRFVLLCALFLLPVLPRLVLALRLPAIVLAGALTAAHTIFAAQAFAGFAQEVGRLDEALASIPPGKTVAGLIFDRGSRHVRFSPFLHAVAYYQVERGGAVMFTFADFPQSPFAFRPQRRPPQVAARWEWLPARVDPARDLAFYDYVLVRGRPGRIARQRADYRRIFRSRRWTVWQRQR